VVLAARGSCNLDNGETKIADNSLVTQLRKRANKIYVKSIIAAAIVTIIAFIIP
jgi:hypothetical protein